MGGASSRPVDARIVSLLNRGFDDLCAHGRVPSGVLAGACPSCATRPTRRPRVARQAESTGPDHGPARPARHVRGAGRGTRPGPRRLTAQKAARPTSRRATRRPTAGPASPSRRAQPPQGRPPAEERAPPTASSSAPRRRPERAPRCPAGAAPGAGGAARHVVNVRAVKQHRRMVYGSASARPRRRPGRLPRAAPPPPSLLGRPAKAVTVAADRATADRPLVEIHGDLRVPPRPLLSR